MTSAYSRYPRCSNLCGKQSNSAQFVVHSSSIGADNNGTAERQQPVYITTPNADAANIDYTNVYGMAKENGYQHMPNDTTACAMAPQQTNGTSSTGTNDSFTGKQPSSTNQTKQSSSGAEENCICKNLLKNPNREKMSSDRLGQWPTESDSETPGNLSGLDRLRNGRFNKVRQYF